MGFNRGETVMTKPTNPNIVIPEGFAISGQKEDFTPDKIQNGFDPIDPDVLAGDNLNKFIDDTYKGLHYSMSGVSDLYKGAVLYDSAESYTASSLVFSVSDDGVVSLYRSLTDNNAGNSLTDGTKWEKVSLGGSGLEILDIGIAPCGINENENKRRYLNGQVIMQEQFAAFTSKLKERVGWDSASGTATLLPNLVKTEMQINEYWKKQELTQSNLLNAINLELEGSTLQGNRVITSDEKYAVVVKNDENLTIEVIKNEEGVLAEGELGLQLEFVQDMNMIYIYPQIGGVESYKQYAERILAEKTKGEKEQIIIDDTGMSSEEFYEMIKENMRGGFYR